MFKGKRGITVIILGVVIVSLLGIGIYNNNAKGKGTNNTPNEKSEKEENEEVFKEEVEADENGIRVLKSKEIEIAEKEWKEPIEVLGAEINNDKSKAIVSLRNNTDKAINYVKLTYEMVSLERADANEVNRAEVNREVPSGEIITFEMNIKIPEGEYGLRPVIIEEYK